IPCAAALLLNCASQSSKPLPSWPHSLAHAGRAAASTSTPARVGGRILSEAFRICQTIVPPGACLRRLEERACLSTWMGHCPLLKTRPSQDLAASATARRGERAALAVQAAPSVGPGTRAEGRTGDLVAAVVRASARPD